MKKALELFFSFFKIGAFTLGGGYAMLSMVEKAVVDQKKWIPNDEFWDMIAVVQSLPGVFAVNTALYVGHRVAGTKGAFAAMLGAIIPSITIILLLATVFREYRDQPVVERIFKGIRPCVVALILAAIAGSLIYALIINRRETARLRDCETQDAGFNPPSPLSRGSSPASNSPEVPKYRSQNEKEVEP